MDRNGQLLAMARELFDDLSFGYAAHWKAKDSSRRIIGYLPIYVPREIIHAAGMLPVGIFGGGDRIPVIRGDAYFQSYICHLPRTVIEMALGGQLDDFDGFLFPAICDVIRNLSGVFRLHFKERFIRYLDFPQNFDSRVGGSYYRRELEKLVAELRVVGGRQAGRDDLNRSLALYNRNRRLLRELSHLRAEFPHKISASDHYLVFRAGTILSVEDHNAFLEELLPILEEISPEPEDKIRVVISGSFCEQPPLGLIKTIENAGCYIVEDDFYIGQNWIQGDIAEDTNDPLGALVDAYLSGSVFSSAVFEGDHPKGDRLAARVEDRRADGVIFCAPSFCDPALLDRPMLERAMDEHGIKHFSFQYNENLGQFHVIKEQAGTFADMIKLWE